ncbi:hypothetical protein CC117_00225 [Parafrankia colletiae]|uniref:Uncharacterized protein n=1 Tax=Parafrankia colletiae TaxID=573497 RepID=A0A1S1RK23_9ACTN|nr:hypothetical protein [Parafrankia colletiae]MCK9902777.1 hypothetical protein [Frankia sp. Cpl3]OHV46139.1 hypothetical protein CC117_00225 [Parafrankia colletiae]
MGRLGGWLGRYAESLISLAVAFVVAILSLVDVLDVDAVNSSILLVLALLAAAVLRDRAHGETVERALSASRQHLDEVLTPLTPQVARLNGVGHTLELARVALDETLKIRVISGTEVTDALAEARADTREWMFKGGTGTYMRAVTLPSCVEAARRGRRELKMSVEIIDPTDRLVCERYARFRRDMSPGPDGTGQEWTFRRTRNEAYAMILAAAWYEQRFNLLDIDVRLSPVMTTFRWDLSSHCLIITQDDPGAASTLIRRGGRQYDSWRIELRKSLDQARRVPMELADQAPLSEEPRIGEARALLDCLAVPLPAGLPDVEVEDIIDRAIRARNPYA